MSLGLGMRIKVMKMMIIKQDRDST